MGSIGKEAASATPALAEALKNENVRDDAIYGLGRIAESYQDNASKLSSTDLDKAISTLEKALKASDDLKDKFTDEQKAPLPKLMGLKPRTYRAALINYGRLIISFPRVFNLHKNPVAKRQHTLETRVRGF